MIDAWAIRVWSGTGQSAVEREGRPRGALRPLGAGHRPSSYCFALHLLPVLLALSVPSHAAEQPPLPDELAVTDSIVMTDRDELYVSPAIQYFRLPDQRRLTLSSEFAYGFTDRLQLTTHLPYAFVTPDSGRTTSGIGDVSVTTRYGVLNYREQPFGLDVGLGLQVPTGDRRRDLGE